MGIKAIQTDRQIDNNNNGNSKEHETLYLYISDEREKRLMVRYIGFTNSVNSLINKKKYEKKARNKKILLDFAEIFIILQIEFES